MKPNQKNQILEMLRNAPDRTVSVRELAACYLYHRAAARVHDLNRLGHDIRYIKGTETMDGKYQLHFDKDLDRKPEFQCDGKNQYFFA